MSTDAIIRFENLRCVSERDGSGGSEPYIWPALVWIDRQTLSLPDRIGFSASAPGNARRVIKSGMRAGNVAPIPGGVNTLRVRLEDDARPNFRRLLPIVALWENDETPKKALEAGFTAYMQTLRSEMIEVFRQVTTAGGPSLDSLLPAALRRVFEATVRAGGKALSGFETFEVAIGSLNLDDFVSIGSRTWNATANESFTLTLRSERDRNHYELAATATLKPVVVDRCQARVDAVRAAEAAISDLQVEIADWQAQLSGQGSDGGPLSKPDIVAEIQRLREEELPPLLEALDAANRALDQCRRGGVIAQVPEAGALSADYRM